MFCGTVQTAGLVLATVGFVRMRQRRAPRRSTRLRHAAVSILGQKSGYLGVMIFADDVAFAAYIEAGRAVWCGVDAALPPHLMFDFQRGGDLTRAVRKEIAAHGWIVAHARAHPWLTSVDKDDISRLPTPRERSAVTAS